MSIQTSSTKSGNDKSTLRSKLIIISACVCHEPRAVQYYFLLFSDLCIGLLNFLNGCVLKT